MNLRWAGLLLVMLGLTVLATAAIERGERREKAKLDSTVHWMGHPLFFEGDTKAGSFRWADDVELGCRADGVMVWRRSEMDTNAFQGRFVYPRVPTNF